jgi:hypothetical protein
MDEAKLRAWWSFRQGLDGSLRGKSPAQVLEQCGWARSVGGVGPYLTLFSRAGTSKTEAEKASAAWQIHELPSARGCTYVLPAGDFALGLKVGEEFGKAEMKVAYKLGVTDKEVDKLCDAVVKTLAKGPLEPARIRETTGNASRSLGEEGKKKGLTTTLPLALGRLQSCGEIQRISLNGRIDSQRYQYELWRPNPLDRFKLSLDEAFSELARRYFRWIGPATPAEFQWFSGLGVKAAKAAIEPLKLVPVEEGNDRIMFADDRDKFAAFKIPAKPQYALVSSVDAISLLRRDIKALVDKKDLERNVVVDKLTKPLGGLSDLPNHAILDRGRLVGLWEYDAETQSVARSTFGVKDKALDAAVAEVEKYIREQLEDARSFGLDDPKSRQFRIAALRQA